MKNIKNSEEGTDFASLSEESIGQKNLRTPSLMG